MKNKFTKRRRKSEFAQLLETIEIDEAEINEFLQYDNWYDHKNAFSIMKHHLFLFKKAAESSDDRGLVDFVIGDYNTGKSTLVRQWMYDLYSSDLYQLQPREIIYFEVPPGTRSDKLLFAKILEREFGEKFALNELKNHIQTVDILDRLIENFILYGTKVVILDEIQLLLQNPLNRRIFNNLKYLMNFSKWGDTPVKTNWILCGTEDSKRLLKLENWIHERTNVLHLNPYSKTKEDKLQIGIVVTMIWKDWTDNGWFDRNLWKLADPDENDYNLDTEVLSKLHDMSGGKIGKLYQIMKKAGWWALISGRRYITMEDFVEGAFRQSSEYKIKQDEINKSQDKVDPELTDSSVLLFEMENSYLGGICIFCENKHRNGTAYERPHSLKDHYQTKHPDEIKQY